MRQYAIQYNHLGQLTQVTDDAGVRTIGYNAYGEQETDSLLAEGVTHLITETRDAMGRSTGFMYAKDGIVQHTVMTDYASDGRINSAGFVHEGEEKLFRYDYLPGSSLLHSLTHPNGVTLMQTYEAKRDLITEMLYINGNQTAASRRYEYDSMGHPTTRYQQQEERKQRDSFEYNSRSELTAASLGIDQYTYRYDNIGNRILAEGKAYTTNELNQYASVGDFVPQFDADGDQTLLKTETGVWQVEYNAENRPVRFTRVEGTSTTVVECAYDSMGRRATKKVSVNGSITLYQRFLYRGYLQIACCDLTRSNHPCLWIITWESPRGLGGGLDKLQSMFAPQGRAGNVVPASHPTQPIATRPLAIQKDGTWYTYGWDLTKNICEVYGPADYIRSAYTYAPYGEVTAAGDVTQPIQWSSEHNDTELGLVYYNYRHYNPVDGRWLGRDIMASQNLYNCFESAPVLRYDYLGAMDPIYGGYLHGIGVARDVTNLNIETVGYILGKPCDPTNIYTLLTRALFIDYIELVRDVKEFNPNKKCTSCIREMYIYVHGQMDEDQAIMEVIKNGNRKELRQSDNSNTKQISKFINNLEIEFCNNAHLYIRSCNIGRVKSIKEEIEKHYQDKNITVHTYEYIIYPSGIRNIFRDIGSRIFN